MKRVLLKLSGEALAGDKKTGFDEATCIGVANQVKKLVDDGIQVAIVTGGGNFWRGRTSETIDRTKADQIGMLATVMNCIYVSDIFRYAGMKTEVFTPFVCGSFTSLFSKDAAVEALEQGKVIFFAGGTGHPYFSTDTGAVLRAIEIEADAMLLAKAIDGIYDSDPKVNPNAVKYDEISIQEVIDKKLVDDGIQVAIVTGGGNFWRGRTSETIDRTKADQIGMLATVMNCIYVSEIFRYAGMKTEVFTPFVCGAFTSLFSKDAAVEALEAGKVIFFAGGTGHPYFSTDTGAVLRAIEIEADAMLLAKAIDGIYDSDPKVNPNAVKYDEISIQEVIDKKLAAVDLTASILCLENKMPMLVFGLGEENSIVETMSGNFTGTKVTV